MPVVEIAIPPRSPYVGVVRLAVSSLARTAGLDEEKVDDIRIAVSEACTNAVLAHEESGSHDPVAITWSDVAERIEIDVDQAVATPDDPATTDSAGFSTRSVLSGSLLESLVDECTFTPRPGGGTRTHLVVLR
ncbi:MAG: ATP-binding protein [Actinomycetota bacterium]